MKQEDLKVVEVTGAVVEQRPSPEVEPRPRRRRFTAEYKQRILRQADACSHGELGALLRREGLYSSHLEVWRQQRERGELAGLAPQKRGRKPVEKNPLQPEVVRLQRRVKELEHRLKQAELIIGVQKKVSEMLGVTLPSETTLEDET